MGVPKQSWTTKTGWSYNTHGRRFKAHIGVGGTPQKWGRTCILLAGKMTPMDYFFRHMGTLVFHGFHGLINS